MKQNTARSAVEQSADLCTVFCSLKQHQKTISVEDIPWNASSNAIISVFKKAKDERKIFLRIKKKTLINFLTAFPVLLTKSVSAKMIED